MIKDKKDWIINPINSLLLLNNFFKKFIKVLLLLLFFLLYFIKYNKLSNTRQLDVSQNLIHQQFVITTELSWINIHFHENLFFFLLLFVPTESLIQLFLCNLLILS